MKRVTENDLEDPVAWSLSIQLISIRRPVQISRHLVHLSSHCHIRDSLTTCSRIAQSEVQKQCSFAGAIFAMATFPPSYNQYAAYDPVRRSSQPISPRVHGHGHGSLDRATLYTQYGGHLDTRHDPTSYRSCILPTPIHETDTDSNHGRRRIQVAVGSSQA